MHNNAYQHQNGGQLKIAIKEDQVTVAPGGRTTIQVGILNEGPSEDHVDVRVRGVPSDWVTIHTPVVHLTSGEAKLVTLTFQPDSISDGGVSRYPLDVHVVSQVDPQRSAVARRVLTVAAYQSRGRIGVILGSTQFSVTPGTSITIPILLENRGDEEDSFRLNVIGLPATWILSHAAVPTLEPYNSEEIQLTLQIPRSPEATAGQMPFTLQVVSQLFPTQTTEVECILTLSAFSQFSTFLEPGSLPSTLWGQVVINNEGNTVETYSLTFQSRDNALIFEKAVRVVRPDTQQAGTVYVEIPQGEGIQVQPGERGTYPFRTRLRSRPILGNEEIYPFGVEVRSSANQSTELTGQVQERALFSYWSLSVGAVGFLVLCLLFLIPFRNLPTSARATQTAASSQTQMALSAEGDSDGDGLTNAREGDLGTDPLLPDTDNDRLLDREEVETYQTNPLVLDTDADRLPDGDEVQIHLTDPRNPDMDGDGRADGDEIAGGSDPRNPDSDGDGLRDGDEIRLEADPLNPDSDGDGLQDGAENETCPLARDPDSDDDGITDGRDLDPCNATNPALTATAAASAAQATAAVPTTTNTPSQTPPPTAPSLPTSTHTPPPPTFQGLMLFESNRTGNSEIYALNLTNQSLARLTNNPAQDVQPALAPDSIQVAYVSNQDGNNEIYLGGIDSRAPLNLTNHPGDDQEPIWSPDGNWIAFTSNRDGNQEIYIMRRDGSEVRNLTQNTANDFAPTWFSVGSPLGSQDWIAFTSARDGNNEVYKVRPDGSGLTNLSQNPANDHSPSGFTGGAILAFVSDRNGNSEIYVMTDTGGAPNNITNHTAQDTDPSIQPGGVWVAFSTDRDGNLEIYVVRIDGSNSSYLIRDPGQDRYPDW